MRGDSPQRARRAQSFLSIVAGIPAGWQLRIVLVMIGLTVLLTLVMRAIGASLVTGAAPKGIVSFELAGSVPAAEAILASWSPQARLSAALSLGVDYLYIPVYAATFSLLCRMASRRIKNLTRIGAWLGVVLAWGMLAAGVLDGIENFALIRVLFGDATTLCVKTAWLCASVKFSLIGLAGLYVVSVLLAILFEFLFR